MKIKHQKNIYFLINQYYILKLHEKIRCFKLSKKFLYLIMKNKKLDFKINAANI